MTKFAWVFVVAAMTVGCGSKDRSGTDTTDAATTDAGATDGATLTADSSTPDSSAPDANAGDANDTVDATTPDADALDASFDDATFADVDAVDGTVPPSEACNPLAPLGAQGCATGQKCTWIMLTEDLGMLGCVPDGTVAPGEACVAGEPGAATGYDNCVAGASCANGTCRDICGFEGGTDSACAEGFLCTRYDLLFANGDDDPAFGLCNPTCDPLTQRQGDGSSCGEDRGCYLLSSDDGTIGVCAGAGSSANVHNVEIRAPGLTTPVYVNSCAPGFMPREATQGTGAAIECGGFCKPAPVYGDTPAGDSSPAIDGVNDGRMGRPNYEGGDTRFMNWNDEPATCVNAAGGSSSLGGATVDPSNPITGESCQFYYMNERYEGISHYSNSVGLCFQFRQWQFDGTPPTDGSTAVPDTAWPSCRDLNRASPALPADVIDGAAYFGCTALESEVTELSASMSVAPPALRTRRRSTAILRDRLAPPR